MYMATMFKARWSCAISLSPLGSTWRTGGASSPVDADTAAGVDRWAAGAVEEDVDADVAQPPRRSDAAIARPRRNENMAGILLRRSEVGFTPRAPGVPLE